MLTEPLALALSSILPFLGEADHGQGHERLCRDLTPSFSAGISLKLLKLQGQSTHQKPLQTPEEMGYKATTLALK